MASLYTLACVDEGGGARVLSPIGASTGPQLCGEIGRQLGLSSDATFEYWDMDFSTWVPIHLELLDMPKRARVQVSLRVDEGPYALFGAPAMMSTVADERPVEMETSRRRRSSISSSRASRRRSRFASSRRSISTRRCA